MSEWNVQVSKQASRTNNPIRSLVDQMKIEPNPDKEVIKLSLGDPTIHGNLPFPKQFKEAIIENIETGGCAGYGPATGVVAAKQAISEKYASMGTPVPVNGICITSGCSHAIQIAMAVLLDPETNILLPKPGFSPYTTIADFLGVQYKFYNLNPKQNWQVDMKHLEEARDENTRAILINNPSNPCGSVFSKEHLQEILAFAEKYKLPIIADEVYCNMAFTGYTFHPMASLTNSVPILTCGGLAKQYLMPGYRVGWLLVHDQNDVFAKANIAQAVRNCATVMIGANTLMQSGIPKMLKETPQSFYDDTNRILEENANTLYNALKDIKGVTPSTPQGAMYMMIEIDVSVLDVDNDVQFSELLYQEESVFVLPGLCFNIENFVRVVICPPKPVLLEAAARISAFCQRHQRQ